MKKDDDEKHEQMVKITAEIQEFIQKLLTETDEPLMVAGCLAAQIRHLYVALCGEETTHDIITLMLEGLHDDGLNKGLVDTPPPTIH